MPVYHRVVLPPDHRHEAPPACLLLTTPRLTLRQWSAGDRELFAEMNGDPEVMAHYPRTLTRAESDHLLDRIAASIDQHGFGLWAAERRSDGELLGFVGLQHVPFEAHYTPAIELGWRLRRAPGAAVTRPRPRGRAPGSPSGSRASGSCSPWRGRIMIRPGGSWTGSGWTVTRPMISATRQRARPAAWLMSFTGSRLRDRRVDPPGSPAAGR